MTQNNGQNTGQNNTSYTPLLNCGCTGCLMMILLLALTTMSVRECKRHKMSYEEYKIKHEMFMDSINRAKQNTIDYRGI